MLGEISQAKKAKYHSFVEPRPKMMMMMIIIIEHEGIWVQSVGDQCEGEPERKGY
jgi:hypothetical protein